MVWEEKLGLNLTEVVPNVICKNKQEQIKIIGMTSDHDTIYPSLGVGFLTIILNKTTTLSPSATFNNKNLINVTMVEGSCTSMSSMRNLLTPDYTVKPNVAYICTELTAIVPEFDEITNDTLLVQNPMPCVTSSITLASALTTYACPA